MALSENVKINLKIEAAESAKTVSDLKKSLKQLKDAAVGVDENSEAFRQLQKAAGGAKDKINDLNDAIKAQSGEPIENVAGSVGLLGDKIKGLDFKGAAGAAKGLAGNIKEINFKELTKGMGDFGSSLMSIGKALLTNPIFLIAAAIAAIVLALTVFKDKLFGVSAAYQDNIDKAQKIAKAEDDRVASLDAQHNLLKLQGKSEKQILEIKKKALDADIKAHIGVLAAMKAQRQAQIDTAKRNKDILQGIIKFVEAPIIILLKGVDLLRRALGQESDLVNDFTGKVANLIFDPEDVAKKADETIDEATKALNALVDKKAESILAIQDIDNKAYKESKAARDKEQDEIKKNIEKEYEAHLKYLADVKAVQDAEAAEELKRQEDQAKVLHDLTIANITDKKALLDAQYAEEQAKYADNLEILKQLDIKYNDDVKALNEDAAKKQEALDAKTASDKQQLEQQSIAASQALSDAFFQGQLDAAQGNAEQELAIKKKQFEVNKAFQISTAIMSGVKSVMTALETPFPVGQILAGVNAALAAANIIKIASTQFNSGGGGGGAAKTVSKPNIGGSFGGGGVGNTANLYKVGSNQPSFVGGSNQQKQGNSQQPVIKAFVVSSDITNQQNKDAIIKRRASL